MPEARPHPSSLEGVNHAGHRMPAPPYRARGNRGTCSGRGRLTTDLQARPSAERLKAGKKGTLGQGWHCPGALARIGKLADEPEQPLLQRSTQQRRAVPWG